MTTIREDRLLLTDNGLADGCAASILLPSVVYTDVQYVASP